MKKYQNEDTTENPTNQRRKIKPTKDKIEKRVNKCPVELTRKLQFAYIKHNVDTSQFIEQVKPSQCTVCGKKLSNNQKRCSGACNRMYHKDCLLPHNHQFYCKFCISAARSSNRECCFVCNMNNIRLPICGHDDCNLHYDVNCLKVFRGDHCHGFHEIFYCPRHYCVTCYALRRKYPPANFKEKLISCLMCPNSYHESFHCLPAGTVIVSEKNIICPDHFEGTRCNLNFCFNCGQGGRLLCCDSCPASFHQQCLLSTRKIFQSQEWHCGDCVSGLKPLYGDVVWTKFRNFRWWPSEIVLPNKIPSKIAGTPHKNGEFLVRFFSDGDEYAWVTKNSVFKFSIEDDMGVAVHNTSLDEEYIEALTLGKKASQLWTQWINDIDANYFCQSASVHYKKIKSNIYVGNAKPYKFDISEIPRCECTPKQFCSDDTCYTRSLMQECHPQRCPNGDDCNNRFFTKKVYPKQNFFQTANKTGYGLMLLEDVKKDDFINEYVGEVITEVEMTNRLRHLYIVDDTNFYFLYLSKNRIIDAKYKGNLSRFINHSCDPNLTTQIWNVNGECRVGFFALKDIKANTELTFNYNLKHMGKELLPCQCGTKKCTGFLGKIKKQVPVENEMGGDICFVCKKTCELTKCVCYVCFQRFHFKCVNRKKRELAVGVWVCPWHFCDACGVRSSFLCNMCTTSFCDDHFRGRIVKSSDDRLYCRDHIEYMTELACLPKKRRCSFSPATLEDANE